MATIKSYSDLQQSMKLAEILPLDSADMFYCYGMNIDTKKCDYNIVPTIIDVDNQIDICDIPCWSLAALLGVLPKNLNIGRPSLESNYKGYYWIQYYDEFMQPNNYKTECFNNPVDACVKMIIRLSKNELI